MISKIILMIILNIILILFIVDNNSSIELVYKFSILLISFSIFKNTEIRKMFFIFYFLFFIFYFSFFIFYFLSNNEELKHFTNFIYICILFIFNLYFVSALFLLFKDFIDFFKYNSIIFIGILFFILRNYLGLRSGISNMVYTKFDVFLFLLGVLQVSFTLYILKIRKNEKL